MIPESFKRDLLARVDVVDVVSRHVELKKAGNTYIGLCPFHDEKTPSFNVIQTKQFFHCHGCGKNGDAIGFLMLHQGIGYVDAIKQLAASVGLEVPDRPMSTAERQAIRKSIQAEDWTKSAAHEATVMYLFFANVRHHHREAGFSDDDIALLLGVPPSEIDRIGLAAQRLNRYVDLLTGSSINTLKEAQRIREAARLTPQEEQDLAELMA